MKIEIDSEWLHGIAEQEVAKIRSKHMSRLKFMVTPKKKIRKNEDELLESAAKIELIQQIFEKSRIGLELEIKIRKN